MSADIIELSSKRCTCAAIVNKNIPHANFCPLSRCDAPGQPRQPSSFLPATENLEAVSIIGRNKRLRAERGEAWRKAGTSTRYWRMMMDFYCAVYVAQREGLAEACHLHRRVEHSDHGFAVLRFREATVAQLLTPAPTVAAVNWKRATFANGDWKLSGHGNAEQIEASIESDVAFLAAHPARQPVRGAGRERG